jgi:hypothetical protein
MSERGGIVVVDFGGQYTRLDVISNLELDIGNSVAREWAKHSAAGPQPILGGLQVEPAPDTASAAKADFKKVRCGRAEARPSATSRDSARRATKSRISRTENAEKRESEGLAL